MKIAFKDKIFSAEKLKLNEIKENLELKNLKQENFELKNQKNIMNNENRQI